MFKRIAILSVALSLNTISLTSAASSALVFDKNKPATIAMNMDWKYREGALVIHPREQLMVSSVDSHKYHPLIWKNRYGSVVFHGGSRFNPGPAISGMNEKGMTASVLMHEAPGYSSNEESPTLNTSEWVRYVLDNFESVQDVINESAHYQLLPSVHRNVMQNYHLIISDAQGQTAVLEYINGQLVIHNQEQLKPAILTNSDYDSSLALLNDYHDFGGTKALPGGDDSHSRFIRAASYMKKLPGFIANEERLAYAFNGLGLVAQAPGTPLPTQMSAVFDITSKTIYFRSINEAAPRSIALNDINFDEFYEPLSLNPFQHLSGNVVAHFKSMN